MIYDLEQELNRIKETEQENPNEALECYSRLLGEEMEEKGRLFYQFGCFLHRFGEEEMALDLFVQAFEKDAYKEEILEVLKRDFWEPNLEEFRQAYLQQTGELKGALENYFVPAFEELPYLMFPVSDIRFMVYHQKEDRFLGWICLGEALEEKNLKEAEAFFPVILDRKAGSLQDLLCYFHQNRNRYLYVLEKDAEWTGLLMVPGIRKEMSSTVPMQGLQAVEKMFSGSCRRLPEIIRIEDESLANAVRECLQKEHERRIKTKEERQNQPLLTIGIPSWNRGGRAKKLVEHLCTLPLDVDLEILVSNNGSDKGVEEYHAIRDMEDSRVTYEEFEENKMYYGNIAQVLRKASGRWVMLLSDEDDIDEKQLFAYMERLEQFREDVAVIRPGTTKMNKNLTEMYKEMGEEAITAYSLRNNYVSGATYNRKFMTEELVNKIEKKWIDNYAYQIYAHMIIDWYMCKKGDFYCYPPIVVIEGEAETVEGEDSTVIKEYNKYENRIRQFYGYVEVINGMEETTDREKVILFLTSGTKTIMVIYMIKQFYILEGRNWDICQRDVAELIYREYEKLNVSSEELEMYRDSIIECIEKTVKEYPF